MITLSQADNVIQGGINLKKHVWEGWTVIDFIEALKPQVEMIMSGKSWQKPFKTKDELAKWCTENQPYYKQPIPEVIQYFTQFYLEKHTDGKTQPMVYAFHEDKSIRVPISEIVGIAVSSWTDGKIRIELAVKGDAFQERYAVTIVVCENMAMTDVMIDASRIWDAIRENRSISITW